MPAWIWVIIAIAIAAALLLALEIVVRRRRTANLRRRFGPEYDRTVGVRDTQRSAEVDLAARQERRSGLQITPLPQTTRVRFIEEWKNIQPLFVDQPSNALVAAQGLVDRVLGALGYPAETSESQADLLSVDHPHLAESYRVANGICERARVEQAGTEELRDGLLRYRSVFEELIDAQAAEEAAIPDGRDGDAVGRTGPSHFEQRGSSAARDGRL